MGELTTNYAQLNKNNLRPKRKVKEGPIITIEMIENEEKETMKPSELENCKLHV